MFFPVTRGACVVGFDKSVCCQIPKRQRKLSVRIWWGGSVIGRKKCLLFQEEQAC